jgi:predicted porin
MNKKLMALAVAGAVAAPGLAVAQTSVTPTSIVPSPGIASNSGITFYGRLDEIIIVNKYATSATGVAEFKKGDVWAAGNAMGFKGREDLGGGTAAWFQLEIGVWPDGRTEASATTGNNWGGRNSAIGISSGIGDVLVGIWDTPYKQTFGVWNSITSGGFSAAGITIGNGDTTGALTSTLPSGAACANIVSNATGTPVTTTNGVCVTEATSNGTGFSRRVNNSVQYWTPIIGGFQAKLMTALANYQQAPTGGVPSGLPTPQEYSLSLAFVQGPFSVGAGYDAHKGLRPGTAAGADPNPKDTAWQLGAKFNMGIAEIGAAYESISYGANNGSLTTPAGKMDVPSWAVNGRFNLGPGALWASYSKTDAKSCSTSLTTIGSAACGVQAKMYALGYDYVLSKRTKLYVSYAKIDNGVITTSAGNSGSSYYYIAGPAANTNGSSGGLSPGTDVTSYGFGIQHVF